MSPKVGNNSDSVSCAVYPPWNRAVRVSGSTLPECISCARGRDVKGCGDVWEIPGVQDKRCFRPIGSALDYDEVEE